MTVTCYNENDQTLDFETVSGAVTETSVLDNQENENTLFPFLYFPHINELYSEWQSADWQTH
jgi:hypothetical protein